MAAIRSAAMRRGRRPPAALAGGLLLFLGGLLLGAWAAPWFYSRSELLTSTLQATSQQQAQCQQQAAADADDAAAERHAADDAAAGEAGAEEAAAEGDAKSSWGDPPANLQMESQLPDWAECLQGPCNFTHMVAGPADTSKPWNSQFGEDAWLYHNLFYERRDGFYLEMGAMAGKDLSNSWWFYDAAGWKGMLIEADPGMYVDLAQNRPDAITVHAAACGEFRTVHWTPQKFNVGGIWEFMADEFKKRFHADVDPATLQAVPCVPMQYILDKFGVASVDLWSLDVEGAELEVLRTVDWSRFSAKVIMAELDGNAPAKDQAVVDLLTAAGYQALPRRKGEDVFNDYNAVFVHRDAWRFLSHAPNITEVKQ